MEQKIIKVYYNENGLPFQDLALTKPYSIVGSEFTGANNATEVHFYVANIDDTYTWVANIKLQDGTMTYRLLTSATDEESEPYKLLVLDNGITAKKGFIYVGLNGYGGETLIEEVEGVLTINGNPIIVATGTISIALNYNPVVIPLGTSVEPTEMQQILANLSQKLEQDDLDTALVDYLQLAGGTMSGAISQPVAPVVNYDLANKKYVDDSVKVATDDIADIIDGDLTVHTAYHAEMDVYGNVIPTYYQPKLTFDTTPTASSVKPVTSGGIKSYVDNNVAEIGVVGGGYSSLLELVNNETSSSGVFNVSRYLDGGVKPVYMLKWADSALILENYRISIYSRTGGTWYLVSKLALDTQVGASLSLNATNFVLALKNSSGTTLSSVDLPLESVVVSGSYDDTTQSLVLTLQNGAEITIPVADLVDGLVPNTRTIAGVDLADDIIPSELKTALSLVKADVGLGNVINPNAYNNIGVATDLDTITISGTYTCYGNANGVPSADYSWFILHLNSGVGTAYAKQIAFAYDGKIYVRFKSTTWGAWAFIPANTLGFDNTIKNLLVATNLQEAVDEVSEKVADITATYAKMISGTTFAGYVASPSISHSGYYVINDDTSLIYLKGSLYSLTSAGVATLISSTSESWYGSQEEYDDIAVKNPNTMYYIEEA